jgi:glutamyl-tRNA synthetase
MIRVRFAPSPTGYLHIGGLRTALFNYLFARHHNGTFILRIEDTDKTRQVEGAVENLISTLKTMGLDYDEGPDVGGRFGPYTQSERLGIYRDYAEQLINRGDAYYCFCTPERLEEVRKIQRAAGKQTQYDRFCRNLPQSEVAQKLGDNILHVIRLKVPPGKEMKFDDLIRGTVKIESDSVDDQVIIKSDGYPTYHLANVVDDHLMEISHIIRGEEWLTSVPKHILIYRALNWEVPKFAHVPLILNRDKTKLSKRQGDAATEDLLKKGYLPEALLNFIALLGWHPGEGEEREIFSKEELIKLFSLERVNPAGAVFNREKLDWMNAEYIKNYDIERLTELSRPFLPENNRNKKIIEVLRTYINRLDELPTKAQVFYRRKELTNSQKEFLESEESHRVVESLKNKLVLVNEFTPDNFKPLLSEVSRETGIKGKALFHPVRLLLTGEEHGPDLGSIAYVLGKDEVISRLKNYA